MAMIGSTTDATRGLSEIQHVHFIITNEAMLIKLARLRYE